MRSVRNSVDGNGLGDWIECMWHRGKQSFLFSVTHGVVERQGTTKHSGKSHAVGNVAVSQVTGHV